MHHPPRMVPERPSDLRRRAPTSVWWIEPRIAVSNKCFHTTLLYVRRDWHYTKPLEIMEIAQVCGIEKVDNAITTLGKESLTVSTSTASRHLLPVLNHIVDQRTHGIDGIWHGKLDLQLQKSFVQRQMTTVAPLVKSCSWVDDDIKLSNCNDGNETFRGRSQRCNQWWDLFSNKDSSAKRHQDTLSVLLIRS
jgi:hypothetical protein